jgi:small redox-active disulfide protein 2
MKIQVLGSGCPTCHNLYKLTQQAVKELKLNERVDYLTGDTGIQKIIEMGVIQSPVLAIDGKPVMTGFTPDIKKIKSLIMAKR